MNDIFEHSDAPDGRLRCIVEGDHESGSVFMYLHDLATKQVIGDAPVCSLVPLISLTEFKRTYRRGSVPPLVDGYFDRQGVIPDLDGSRIAFVWDADGSVTVTLDDRPVSRISSKARKGSCVFVTKDGPWGKVCEPDAAPNSRPPSQFPSSPEVQSSDSQRTPSSGGCG